MKLAEAAALLRLHCEEWDDGSVQDLAVFGSVARDEAHAESDVDVLLSFKRPVGLLHLVRFKLIFEELLGRRVDVATPEGLKPALRAGLLASAVSVMRDPVQPAAPHAKRWRWRVREMLAALARTRRYTQGLDLNGFLESDLVQDAVLHNLLVVGESVNYLPEDVRLLHPEVPWAALRQMRHLIAHEYFGLDPRLVWLTVTQELPPVALLLQEVAERRVTVGEGGAG